MTLQHTPTEDAICEATRLARLLGCIVHAMALASTDAALNGLMNRHAEAVQRLRQMQRSEL